MNPLNDIEKATKEFADAREELISRAKELLRQMDEVKNKMRPHIKRAIGMVADRHNKLQQLITENPQLFRKPKLVVFHGIKVGYKKAKGGIIIVNAKRVIELIRRHMPELEEALIKTTEKPVKSALAQLTVADLKRLGCTVEETTDKVHIQATDSEVDKAINALVADAIGDEVEEAA